MARRGQPTISTSATSAAEKIWPSWPALAPLHPRLRDFPPELPFLWDTQTLLTGLNFTLRCDAGDIDLLGEVTGLGGYEQALKLSQEVDLYGSLIKILSLEGLELTKRAAGRAKDFLDLEIIAALRNEQEPG